MFHSEDSGLVMMYDLARLLCFFGIYETVSIIFHSLHQFALICFGLSHKTPIKYIQVFGCVTKGVQMPLQDWTILF